MTKLQKKNKLQTIRVHLQNQGFVQDSYGNFKLMAHQKQFAGLQFRVKIKTNNIRFEHKAPNRNEWKNDKSVAICRLELDHFYHMVNIMKGY